MGTDDTVTSIIVDWRSVRSKDLKLFKHDSYRPTSAVVV